MKINSVLGPVDTADLGVALMHEHIALVDMNFAMAIPGWYDREKIVEKFCEEAEGLKPYGVRTWVDATAMNIGRDVELLQECSRRSGMTILTNTGLYWNTDPWLFEGIDVNRFADFMIKEVNEGIGDTGVKPAFIKCATDARGGGPTEINQQMVRACAIAARETGLPVYMHSTSGGTVNYGLYQKKIMLEEKVDPKMIAFGHMFQLPFQEDMLALLDGGSYIGYDQMAYFPPEILDTIASMIMQFDEDVRKHMFFSCDQIVESDFGTALSSNRRDSEKNPYMLKDIRKKVIFDTFLPAMRNCGVPEEIITDMTVNNPRRYFEGA